jgi:Holliday junction resolvase RusA-like endonuclease
MNNGEIQKLKKGLKLTQRQREILVGTLLGDGHLETSNDGQTYRLKIEHGVAQQEYVTWLYEEFKEWVRSEPYVRARPDGRVFTGFTTYSHSALRFYGHQFYDRKKKKVPALIHKLLTPLSVAVWYMDDGSRKSAKHKTYIIHTYGFVRRDLENLQKACTNLGIETSLHKQKKDTWRIYVLTRSAPKLREILEQHVSHIKTMQYKIG